jgi:hypothetical protein
MLAVSGNLVDPLLFVMRTASHVLLLVSCLTMCRGVPAAEPASQDSASATAADTSLRALLDALEERQMPDAMLWAVESAGRDPSLSKEVQAELPFMRATALVGLSRTEADAAKRAKLLDEAEKSIDDFLKKTPSGERAIAAFSQKGNLLVERGRGKLAQASRPGADAKPLKAEAAKFFDEAIKSLESPAAPAPAAKPGDKAKKPEPPREIGTPTNAEDAVLKELRAVDDEIARVREPIREVQAKAKANDEAQRPFIEQMDKLDRELHKIEVDGTAIQAAIAGGRQEIAKLRGGPKPDPAAAAKRETELTAQAARLQQLDEQRRKLVAEKRRPDAEIAKLKKQRIAIDRELDDAEKPLEGLLERPLQRQEALRTRLLQTRLMVAEAYYEKSRAFEAGSPEWKAALEASTAGHRELVEKYGKMGVAYLARLNQGRNQALLGDHDAALGTLSPLYGLEAAPGQPISALGMTLKTRALGIALESWLAKKQYRDFTGPAPFDLAEYRKNSLVKFALTPAKGGKPDADLAAVKYRAAVILDARAAEVADKQADAAKVLRQDAFKLAREVALAGREFSKEARDLSAKLGKDVPEVLDEGFDSLVSDARAAVTAMQERYVEAKQAQADGKAAEAAKAVEEAGKKRGEAIGFFEKAITKAGDASGKDDDSAAGAAGMVNDLRATLAFLFYDAKQYPRAVDIGVDLVQNFPNAMGSRKAAKVALASLQSLAQQGDAASRQQAKARLSEVAALIAKTWPSDAEGADAFSIQVGEAIESRNADTIQKLLVAIPAASPRRPEFLMRLGTALRREVQDAGKAEAAARPPEATVAAWNSAAKAAIDEALAAVAAAGSLPPGTGGKIIVAAALARCQMAMETQDFTTVGTILEHPVYGPLKFAEGPVADGSRTVALRYYVETERPEKAKEVLAAMEQAAGQGAEASARLVGNYLAISRDLQAQLEALTSGPKAGSPEAQQQATKILDGFETVLEGLRTRDPKFTSQFFVADTYLALGTGKSLGTVVSKGTIETFLGRAAETFGKLLARKDDASAAAEDRDEVARFEPTIRRRMATILARQGKWDAAQEQIDWILADPKRQNSLEVQQEAAELLEAAGRAAAESDPAKADGLLREAAAGRKADPVQIWGWGGIANKLSRQAFTGTDDAALKSRERFFEARIRVAQILLARARLKGQADRDKRLETATSAIVMTRKLYPDLGGPASARRFESVLKEIQKEQGSPNPDGFRQIDEQAGAAEPAAAAGR